MGERNCRGWFFVVWELKKKSFAFKMLWMIIVPDLWELNISRYKNKNLGCWRRTERLECTLIKATNLRLIWPAVARLVLYNLGCRRFNKATRGSEMVHRLAHYISLPSNYTPLTSLTCEDDDEEGRRDVGVGGWVGGDISRRWVG